MVDPWRYKVVFPSLTILSFAVGGEASSERPIRLEEQGKTP